VALSSFQAHNSNSTLQKDFITNLRLSRASNQEEVCKFSKQNNALLHLSKIEVKRKKNITFEPTIGSLEKIDFLEVCLIFQSQK